MTNRRKSSIRVMTVDMSDISYSPVPRTRGRREDTRHCLPPVTIPAMPFTGASADAIAQEEARVARLESELKESRAT